MKQLYQLKTTVTNPDYDKRCKYGYRAVAEWEIGRNFTFYPAHDMSPAMADFGGHNVQGEIAKLLLSHSEPVQANTWADISKVCGGYYHCADDTINQLLKTGIVTPEQVVKALNDFLDA